MPKLPRPKPPGPNTWIIVDANYMAARAYHATGHLINGTVFGFLRDIAKVHEQFPKGKFAFCWDHGPSWRKKDYPDYKANRVHDGDEDGDSLYSAILNLKQDILERLGFTNNFFFHGAEADDLIASLVKYAIDQDDLAIIVSNDEDFYQLLDKERIKMWRPMQQIFYGEADLKAEYGVRPQQWAKVKAIAGCKGDNVQGVEGVAEATASKYVQHRLKPGCKAWESIRDNAKLIARNLGLVTLPHVETPPLRFVPQPNVNWEKVCLELKMPSIAKRWV